MIRALMLAALLLSLAVPAWTQTVAIAARGLDEPSAWDARLPWRPAQVAVAALLLGLVVILARL